MEEKKKRKRSFGVTFTGNVTFQGPMFDIHDNDHVHIQSEKVAYEVAEDDESLELENDITQPPQEEELNYFQPKLHLTRLLEMEWFDLCRSQKSYTCSWREGLVDALMESQWKDHIAREWSSARKRVAMKGYLMGILKDIGVLKGSYDSIAMVAHIIKNSRTLSRYMGMGKKQPYYSLVVEYQKRAQRNT